MLEICFKTAAGFFAGYFIDFWLRSLRSGIELRHLLLLFAGQLGLVMGWR